MIEKYIESLDKLPLYVNVAVGDLLFRGYQDETTRFIQQLNATFAHFGITLPKSVHNADGSFSLFGRVSFKS